MSEVFSEFLGTGNETPEEILELLRNNADDTSETMTYTHLFTDDQLESKNEEFLEGMIKYEKLGDELAEVKKKFKAEMDPLKMENKKLLHELKNKGETYTENVYKFIDQPSGRVAFYSKFGVLLNSRKIRKGEVKQPGLFKLNDPKKDITIKPDSTASRNGTDNLKFKDTDEEQPF